MASRKLVFILCAALLLLVALATTVESQSIQGSDLSAALNMQWGARQGSLRQSDCPNACSRRCSKASGHKACMFFCVKCCSKCLCVPPGTYGNKQVCPCYNDWKTQQGGPKCP